MAKKPANLLYGVDDKPPVRVCLLLAILNVRTGELTYSNAGHVPPILTGPDGRCEIMPLTPGKPLGIRKQGGFETCRRQMQKGEGILVFTDGVTEAESKTKGFYGEVRLLSLLHGLPTRADADVCVGKVLEGIKEFCAGDPQYDDIAIVCVRYNGNSE